MSERRFASLALLPGGVWLLALFAVPLAITLAISFGVTDELGNALYAWNPDNYERVFDPLFGAGAAPLGGLRGGNGRPVRR